MNGGMLEVGFEDPATGTGDESNVLARFLFAGSGDATSPGGRDFSTGLAQLGGPAVCEVWRCSGEAAHATVDGIRLVASPDFLFASAASDDHDLRGGGRDVYQRLLDLIRDRGYPGILRAWNSVPDINAGAGDDERYKQFCIGRSEAFEATRMSGLRPPAATAVGCAADQPLRVFLLAGRAAPGLLENPRQISAYRYPRQYGPRSPAFSRAAILDSDASRQMLLSGTASIEGHESRHEGDGALQTAETLVNIRRLAAAAKLEDASAVLRVYLRDPGLMEQALMHLKDSFGASLQVVFLAAELCRRELIIEIDGVLRSAEPS